MSKVANFSEKLATLLTGYATAVASISTIISGKASRVTPSSEPVWRQPAAAGTAYRVLAER